MKNRLLSTATKVIQILFGILFALIPLIFSRHTFESFEFPKIVALYFFITLIFCVWILKTFLVGLRLKKTTLDIPIILLLIGILISTAISIDIRTSVLGVYTRYVGGLIPTLSFAAAYFLYIQNSDSKSTIIHLKVLAASSILVAIIGILEHNGLSVTCPGFKNCWNQEVTERIISTFGQPNWVAAWLTATMPVLWGLNTKGKPFSRMLSFLLILAITTSVLYTKSRSGVIALIISTLTHAILSKKLFAGNIAGKSTVRKAFLLIPIFLLMAGIIVSGFARQNPVSLAGEETSSVRIRKLVWEGALNVWKEHPLLGSGTETFYFAFEKSKPPELSRTIEWNFVFNKAHNELLHVMATTGTVGLILYVAFISEAGRVIFKNIRKSDKYRQINNSLFSGFVAIQITNFFGFSTVGTSMLTFIFPAISLSLTENTDYKDYVPHTSSIKNTLIGAAFSVSVLTIMVLLTTRYVLADYYYYKGLSKIINLDAEGTNLIHNAIKLSPNEPIYWSTLGQVDARIALNVSSDDLDNGLRLADISIKEIERSILLSPDNPSILKKAAETYMLLGSINNKYLTRSVSLWSDIANRYPNDAFSKFNYALSLKRSGDYDLATLEATNAIMLRPTYKEARILLMEIHESKGEIDRALSEAFWIVNNIDPTSPEAKRIIDSLGK